MSVIWRKVWLDLWQNKVRTALAVLSIAAGVFAIGATFGMADQLLSGMDVAHQATFPSHIQISTTGFDRDLVTNFRKIEGVEGLELENFHRIRYKIVPEEEWETGLLLMRNEFEAQTYDRYELKDGEWPNGKGLAVERLSSQQYGVEIGDQVIFEIDKREKLFSIVGKVRHPFVRPPQFGGTAVFFADGEGLQRFGIPDGQFNRLLVRVSPYSYELVRDVASEMKDRLAKEGIGVGSTNYQDPQTHWGRPIMEGVNFVLQTMAVLSLAVSVVLVLNTLTALMTQQINQIGIMKAIGAKTGQIVRIYLACVVVYGLWALLISLPLAAWVTFSISQWFLKLFNIDYNQFQLSGRALFLQTLAALLVPLLSALWPVLNGAKITVREALDRYGLGSDFGSSRFDRYVERLSSIHFGNSQALISAPYVMTIRNMFRRRGRFMLTQLVLILGGTMFLVVMNLSSSITLTIDNEFARRQYHTTLMFEQSERIDRVIRVADSYPEVEEAQAWYIHSASILPPSGQALKEGQRTREAGFGAEIVAIPAGSQMFKPMMVAGRWLQPEDERALVISIDSAEENHITLGETITLDVGELGNSEWQVVGLFNNLFKAGIGNIDPIYANQEALFRAINKSNRGNRVYIRMKESHERYIERISSLLAELYNSHNMEVDQSQTLHEFKERVVNQLDIVVSMLLILAIMMAIVGGIGLMGSLSISVVERTKEIGVMRAIGARTHTMLAMFMLEGILQGIFSWLIVVPISYLLGQPMANILGKIILDNNLDYQYNLPAIFIWLLIVLTVSTIASIVPAHHASQISVRESLAYG